MSWQPENKLALSDAISRIERELPGWWWSTGSCSVSAHASIGVGADGPDAQLLEIKLFDEGFHADLSRPSSCADAINNCIDQAVAAKISRGTTEVNFTSIENGQPNIISQDMLSSSVSILDAVKIHRDGRIEVDPKYTTDEAARKFWEAVRMMAPEFFRAADAYAIADAMLAERDKTAKAK